MKEELYITEELHFARDLSLEISADPNLCFRLALFHSVSNIDEVLSINPSANIFVFEDFNAHHKDWLTYSGGTDRLVNSVVILLSQMNLLRWLTFLL